MPLHSTRHLIVKERQRDKERLPLTNCYNRLRTEECGCLMEVTEEREVCIQPVRVIDQVHKKYQVAHTLKTY